MSCPPPDVGVPPNALPPDVDEPPVSLTREALQDGSLLAAIRQRVPPGTPLRSDLEIEAILDRMLGALAPGEDPWLFGYGSLMWNPAMHFAERRAGRVRGWHRSYCLWVKMGRGSPANPGLMLGLDRGGSTVGALFRVPADTARAELISPFRRELFGGAYDARFVTVDSDAGPVRAMTFTINRGHPGYAGRLSSETIAQHLMNARGSLGTCAEYLAYTLESLAALGLSDARLSRISRLVGAGVVPPAA